MIFSYQRLWHEGKNLVLRDLTGLSPCACSAYRVDLLAVNQVLGVVVLVHVPDRTDGASGRVVDRLLGEDLVERLVVFVLADRLVHADLLSWGGFPPFRCSKLTWSIGCVQE
jgi:hypothetical protein